MSRSLPFAFTRKFPEHSKGRKELQVGQVLRMRG
jgi:hypothetical protein